MFAGLAYDEAFDLLARLIGREDLVNDRVAPVNVRLLNRHVLLLAQSLAGESAGLEEILNALGAKTVQMGLNLFRLSGE